VFWPTVRDREILRRRAGAALVAEVVAVPGLRLSWRERDDIAYCRALRMGVREIAAAMGRDPATISRELRRGVSGSPPRYRALHAQLAAVRRAGQSRPRKLGPGSALRAEVAALLDQGWSPGQIAGRLKRDHPGCPELQVSHETIYQALYVQGKGSLRAEVSAAIRCGKARHRRPRSGEARGKIPGMISISQRPAEAADRAVPGHWEGDLIIGAGHHSAVATLAERTTRFCMIIALPRGRAASLVADAIAARITTLPAQLTRSLTWDQGKEMSSHAAFTIATGIPVYFADPHTPWQRGTNENTNGLIRHYLPKGSDLSGYTQDQLDDIARQLNTRPRRILDYATPAEALHEYLVATQP
jgi:transposase, IS30 family